VQSGCNQIGFPGDEIVDGETPRIVMAQEGGELIKGATPGIQGLGRRLPLGSPALDESLKQDCLSARANGARDLSRPRVARCAGSGP
jgi:hypothetical protein